MTTQIPHFIDGQRSTLTSSRTADVLNPSTGVVQAQVLLASKADVDTAVASAVEAQKEWAAWNPQRRSRVLMKFIELVNTNADELAELLSIEHGKTVADWVERRGLKAQRKPWGPNGCYRIGRAALKAWLKDHSGHIDLRRWRRWCCYVFSSCLRMYSERCEHF